ncbi:MAG TPA: hypothetical protein VMU66_10725 [Gaiellales bacterium]|nr:hypothetical protein [Gaiellales bacterium]
MIGGWTQIEGTVHALAARCGDEAGSYLWIAAGEHFEAVEAELFLAAVAPDQLDCAMGVATGSVRLAGGREERSGRIRLQFGRVRGGRGVVSIDGAGLDADIVFTLVEGPREGAFCPLCGNRLEVGVVEVITPPDGGVMGRTDIRCGRCEA